MALAYDRSHAARPLGYSKARAALVRQLRQCLEHPNGHRAHAPHIVRIAVPVESLDVLAWLQAQDHPKQVYWSGRGSRDVVAGIGEADGCVQPLGRSLELLRAHLAPLLTGAPNVRYYGGMRFDPEQAPSGEWASFGAYRFVLPRFELTKGDEACSLACNLVLPRDYERARQIIEQVQALAEPAEDLTGWTEADWPHPAVRVDMPDVAGWKANVRWALKAFETGRLDKVVLAREARLAMTDAVDPVALLRQLQPATPDCFHFLMQFETGAAFVGASPERLFARSGRSIHSEAVAGTRPLGDSASHDAQLLSELLSSEKERREHGYVRVSIRERLGPLCSTVVVDAEPSEMKLARGRHLVSRVRGQLRPGVTSLDVLAALHPTPAVGGYPRAQALETIRTRESFDRGWYAGPVGWVGPNEAEFAVGIRSGLVLDYALSLYSGAGIVAGSEPQAEWDEIEHKISDFMTVLGLAFSPAD